MREIEKIILHCTATREGQDVTVDQVRQWHTMPEPKGRGWSDIGYHFLITLDGTVWAGRPIERAGAHCKGQNEKSIGVCYVGGIDKDGKPKDTRTALQKDALLDLCFVLIQNYNLNVRDVHAHYEYANKACPSFNIDEFRKELDDYIRTLLL